jgi:CheY-like chemotaxis protein
MSTKPTTVLLVGDTARNSSQLLHWLGRGGCDCQTAASYRDACTLLSRNEYDLVLSQYQLPDRTAFPLLDWLIGSSTTLFLSTAVETGSWWLPMLERGERCVGAPIVRADNFTKVLQIVMNAKVPSEAGRVAQSDIRLPARGSEA